MKFYKKTILKDIIKELKLINYIPQQVPMELLFFMMFLDFKLKLHKILCCQNIQ